MPGGRPPFEGKDQLFKDLIEWAKKPDSINLCKFCCTREPPLAPSLLIKWSKEKEEFGEAYEAAKTFIGARREELLTANKLHVKAYDVNANTYDRFLKEERREEKEYEAQLAKQKEQQHPAEVTQAFEKVVEQISQLQSNSKTAEININNDK